MSLVSQWTLLQTMAGERGKNATRRIAEPALFSDSEGAEEEARDRSPLYVGKRFRWRQMSTSAS